ncbi:MAG: S8 family serine peptidase [Gammaproteobacteria bacterium]|nr:S8 family serine peptidase [Gammaproteobacteria bacterium]
MNSIRRKLLVLTLVLGASAFLLFVTISLNEGKRGQPFDETVEDLRQALIQEIREFDSQADVNIASPSTPIPSSVKPRRNDVTVSLAQSSSTSNYSIVGVAADLKKERYGIDRSAHPISASIDSDTREWLTSPSSIEDIVVQAKDSNGTYSWMQISQPMNLNSMQSELSEFGATVLGSAGNLVRLQVSPDKESLSAIRNLPWVSGIGALPPDRKLSKSFEEELGDASPNAEIPVFVSVMASNRESVFRKSLKSLGISVGYFDPTIRVFAAVIEPSHVHDLTRLDFVQSVEPIPIVTATHDTAVPALGVDKLRTIGSLSGTFSGFTGTTTPIAVMDTGLNTNHVDISTYRDSICAKNFVENEDSDLFFDANGHGTHVTGTVAGNGFYVPKYAGMAPGVRDIRFAKVLNSNSRGTSLDILQGMDYLAEESSCVFDGQETEAIRPLIVNMSLSSARLDHDSRSAAARKLDSTVWTYRQLYVVANANSNQYGYSNYGAAKNSLPVGASYDSGEIHGFSSHGPTVDNRLTPLVSATGVHLYSASGWGNYDNYSRSSGTSMASPSVAGLAALLMDASPDHRERPALVRARLMASAVKPDSWFESESQFPRNNTNGPGRIQAKYGMGVVSATMTILNNDSENGWTSSGAAVELENDEYAYHDIEVPEGTSRLDVVMTWDEPATDAIANNVLNDLNLWIDVGADCGTGPCGEYSSLSTIDNVEWVIISNPEAGTYRLKIDANSVYSDAPRAAVAWTIIRGNSAPQLTIEASHDTYETPNGEEHYHNVDLTVSTDSFIAKGVTLHVDCRTLDGEACKLGRLNYTNRFIEREHSALVQRSDGLGVAQVGSQFVLGEITEGNPTNVMLELYAQSSDPMRVYVKAMAWNGKSAHTSFLVRPMGSFDEISIASVPSNDNFERPIVLEDPNGSHEFDLLVSSMEEGEPLHEDARWDEARVAGSVWFQRIPEESGLASFIATPTSRAFPERSPKVQIYQVTDSCCGVSGARLLASSYWSAQLFVKEGYDYRVRVSVADESLPLSINWYQGERPLNDNFADAFELSGESGEMSGSNLGATLEVGELYGYLSSSVWYWWTAPDDGQWEFQIPDAQVVRTLAFVGNDVSDLRLVSDFQNPGRAILVNAKKDQIYRIMVASPNAYSGGWVYDALTWNKVEADNDRNDMFQDAVDLGDGEYGSVSIDHDNWPSIEPDEPESTGILSRWWRWEAPYDGTFTFFWTGADEQVASAYKGSALDNLQPAMLDESLFAENEFLVDAKEGEEYWISAGREKFSLYAFYKTYTRGSLLWGSTPANNTQEFATELVGDQGETYGSTVYATTERDEWTQFGSSSLWYSHEASEAGWFRFWIESYDSNRFRIAAYTRNGQDAGIDFIMASRRYSGQRDHMMEVYVYLEEGMQALLRVAIEFRYSRENFTLRWERSDAPSWLTFAGRLSYGRRDGEGNISRIRNPAEISLNTDGTGLYVTTLDGLQAYRRDTETGQLTLVQVIEDVPQESHHVWDPHRNKLYVNHDFNWWTYAISQEDPIKLELVASFEEENWARTSHELGVPTMAIDGNGDYVFRLGYFSQRVYDFSSEGNLQPFGAYRDPRRSIFASYDGQYWYGMNYERSIAYKKKRILGSPFSEEMAESDLPSWGTWLIQNDHLNQFTFISTRTDFRVFDNQSNPYELANLLTEYNYAAEVDRCGGSFTRKGRYVLDIVCSYGGYVVEYDPAANDAYVTDKFVDSLYDWIPDRFGRSVPDRYTLWYGDGVTASPDGRHIYASTRQEGILIFERYGNDVVDFSDNTNLPMRRLDLLRVGDGLAQFGEDSVNEGCLESSSWTVNNVTYTVASSKWQQREDGSEWSDVADTEVTSQLCTLTPIENLEYRMVARIEIDGETNEYASNLFARLTYDLLDELEVSDGEIELNGRRYIYCVMLADTEIEGKTYTVFNSKWQSRPDSETSWSDVYGTETSGELCPMDAGDLEYRLVGSIMVDGERGQRRSNIMQATGSE